MPGRAVSLTKEATDAGRFTELPARGSGTVPSIMKQANHTLHVSTRGKSLTDITRPVLDWTAGQGIGAGLLTLWCRHTSASLTVQENASPAVRADIANFFEELVPEDPARYAHDDEGPDDMPAHLRAMLTGTTMGIPVVDGRPVLGTWQGLYLFEHRRAPHRREVVLHLLGD
jgi:secondary thiamine-phosphate synthase enzyme